jgi:hypothetical protein
VCVCVEWLHTSCIPVLWMPSKLCVWAPSCIPILWAPSNCVGVGGRGFLTSCIPVLWIPSNCVCVCCGGGWRDYLLHAPQYFGCHLILRVCGEGALTCFASQYFGCHLICVCVGGRGGLLTSFVPIFWMSCNFGIYVLSHQYCLTLGQVSSISKSTGSPSTSTSCL